LFLEKLYSVSVQVIKLHYVMVEQNVRVIVTLN